MALRQLAARRPEPSCHGAALHLKRLATHLRLSQQVLATRCAGPQGGDYSRLLAEFDAGVQRLRLLLTGLRLLRKQHAHIPGPAPGEDPWLHPGWAPFLRASETLITEHLPPIFQSLQRRRAVLAGRPHSLPRAA